MHGVHLARVDGGQAIRRPHRMKHAALERGRREVRHLLGGEEHRLVLRRPVGLPLLHEAGDRGERVVVDRRLDVEHAHRVLDELALPDARVMQRRVGRVHVGARSEQRLDVVVGPDAAVGREARRHRLVAAVHRHERQVHVDHEVRLGRSAVERDLLPRRSLADVDVVVRVLTVVLVETVGMKGAEDPLAHDVPQLVVGHAPVQPQGRDDVQVLDACLGGHVDDLLHHELPYVRRGHGRQREGEIVEGDGQLHAAAEQRLQRVVLQRLGERALDGALGVGDRLQRVGRVDDARAERHLLQPDAFAVVEENRRRVPIHLDHRTRSWHQPLNPRRSNATFTAPSRPALIAYSIASR